MENDSQTSEQLADETNVQTKTLIIMIIDESGSMGSKTSDVIGGFNQFLSDQRKVKGDSARLILVKFNTVSTVVHSAIAIDSVSELNERNYTPGGGTALYDAVADGVKVAEKEKEPSERVLCVVMTDGEENSSRETTLEQCTQIFAEKEASGDWTFVYIGENPERWAKEMGIPMGNVRAEDEASQLAHYAVMSDVTSNFRQSKARKAHNLFKP